MTEFLDLLRQFAPLVASILVPLVGLALKISRERQDPGSVRSMRRHAELMKDLPEAASNSMAKLLDLEVQRYAERTERRWSRKVDGGAVGALLVVGSIGGFGLYWLLIWAEAWWPIYIAAVLWGLATVGLILAGFSQLFYYGEKPPAKTREQRRAERQAQP